MTLDCPAGKYLAAGGWNHERKDITGKSADVYAYANGVIDEALPAPDDDVRLAPEWALQDPDDYLRTFQQAVPAAVAAATAPAPTDPRKPRRVTPPSCRGQRSSCVRSRSRGSSGVMWAPPVGVLRLSLNH